MVLSTFLNCKRLKFSSRLGADLSIFIFNYFVFFDDLFSYKLSYIFGDKVIAHVTL